LLVPSSGQSGNAEAQKAETAGKTARIGGVVRTRNRLAPLVYGAHASGSCKQHVSRFDSCPILLPNHFGAAWRLMMEIIIWSIVLVFVFFIVAFAFAA
jgi:hypothetical protein